MKKSKKLFSFLKKNLCFFLLCLVLNIISGYSKSAGAIYLQKITDTLEAKSTDYILVFVLIGGGLTFVSYVLRWLGAVVPNYLTQKFAYETRVELFTHLSKISFIKYEGYSQGELQSIIQNDTEKAGQIFYTVLSRMLNNIFLFIFSVWVMANTNVPATIVTVLIVLVATAVNQLILKRLKIHEKGAQRNIAEMTYSLGSTFSSMETVKTFWAKDYVMKNFIEKQDRYCENRIRSTRVGAVRTIWSTLIENFCLYGSIGYLGFLGLSGKITIGEVMMFIYLIKQIIMPIEVVLRWLSTLTSSYASFERILEKLDEETENISINTDIPANIKVIKVDDISFSYGSGYPIIKDLDILLESCNITGFSSASGTGKTTLLKILSGLYESPTVKYEIDGKSVDSLKGIVAYASLENSLFPMTIYENIAIANENLTKNDIKLALEKLGFKEWLSSLPEGVDTPLNQNVSGGQRQAVSNARVILSGKPFIILDEPYSALDTAKERALNRILEKEKHNRIILITSHREDVFMRADRKLQLSLERRKELHK